jgi:hypothetical protein
MLTHSTGPLPNLQAPCKARRAMKRFSMLCTAMEASLLCAVFLSKACLSYSPPALQASCGKCERNLFWLTHQ